MTRDSGRLPEGEDAERSGAAECEASQSDAAKTAHRPNDTPNPKIEAQAREMLAADELERHYAARLKAYLAWKRTPEARGPNRTQMAFAAGWEAHKALSLPSVEIRREADQCPRCGGTGWLAEGRKHGRDGYSLSGGPCDHSPSKGRL